MFEIISEETLGGDEGRSFGIYQHLLRTKNAKMLV